jgi:predicted CXXCH cytochrome family protein
VGPEGGTLAPTTGTIRLEIPPGAVEEPTTFTIRQRPEPPDPELGRVYVTRVFDIGPSGTRFRPSARLTLAYDLPDPPDLSASEVSTEVATRFWDPSTETWVAPRGGSTVRGDAATVTTRIAHLSLWATATVPVPHGGYSSQTQLCAVCHDWHDNPYDNKLLVQPTELDVCYGCHDESGRASTNVKTEFGTGELTSFHPVPVAKDGIQLVCSDCHAVHQSPTEDFGLLYRTIGPEAFVFSPQGAPIGDDFCYSCHGLDPVLPAPYGDHSAFANSAHSAVTPPNPDTAIACQACHLPHASVYPALTTASEEQLCYTCHTSDDPNAADGSNPYQAFLGPANQYGPPVRIFHHPIDDAEDPTGTRTVECASCHNSHLATPGSPLVDPLDTSTSWSDDVSAFCLTCHKEPTNTEPVDAGPTVPFDVRMVQDEHDGFLASEWPTSFHGGAGLACTDCHDPHGSTNAYMLKEGVGGLTGFRDDPTNPTDLSAIEGFCTSCHTSWTPDPPHPPATDPEQLCTECHRHGGGRF